jgi:TatA/E family protein of Tat protein translocase
VGDIGIDKLLLILGVVVMFFGPRRLPELGATLGKGIRDFKRNLAGHDDQPLVHPVHDDAAQAEPAEPKRLL